MAHLFYVHWNKDEALGSAKAMQDAGHSVDTHYDTTGHAKVSTLPDAFVISLARLPSHGRAIAEWCSESKQRRAIPLIFVDGARDKVAATRDKFPDARYCTSSKLLAILEKITPTKSLSNDSRQTSVRKSKKK